MNRIVAFLSVAVIALVSLVYYLSNEPIIIGKIALHLNNKKISLDQIKTYVINLDRTPERYIKIKKQLDNFEHERFSAIDGYELELSDPIYSTSITGKDIKTNPDLIITGKKYNINCGTTVIKYIFDPSKLERSLTAGEFGCYCSHVEIWKRMLVENQEYALILEDDAEIKPGFKQYLENELLQNVPQNFDIIYLFSSYPATKQFYNTLLNDQLIQFYPDGEGVVLLSSYIISKNGAQKLLNSVSDFTLPVDDEISRVHNLNKLDIYKTISSYVSAPVGQSPEDSSIYKMGRPHF